MTKFGERQGTALSPSPKYVSKQAEHLFGGRGWLPWLHAAIVVERRWA
jgi:hypothetical protein